MTSIIEETRVPQLMTAFTTFVEVKMIGSIEKIDSIENVFACVRVDNVEQDGKAHSMRSIYQLFEVLGISITRRGSKKGGDLVAKSLMKAIYK
jgi:hypothetical protein